MDIHFGVKLKTRNGGHKLSRENYINFSKRVSFYGSLEDYFFYDNRLRKYPKQWVLYFLEKLLIHYENIPGNEKQDYIKSRIIYIKQEIGFIKSLDENSHEVHMLKEWNPNCGLTQKEYIGNQLKKFYRFIEPIDWDIDILGRYYKDTWCNQQRKDALQNYDINMAYFKSLDKREFDQEIENFIKKNPLFIQVNNIQPYIDKEGYYMLVCDEYKQLYIGTSFNIGKRIRQHWSASKPFDRLVFPIGNVKKSIISFDSYRAKDTTRIYIYVRKQKNDLEDKFIRQINPKFVGNRLSGGTPLTVFEASLMIKERDMEL